MEAKHVYKTYHIKGDKKGEMKIVEAVKDVSLQIRKGDIKLIFGPSGSGKSTFALQFLFGKGHTDVTNIIFSR